LRLDLFCRVIDNYGDIGVCWRLARQLNVEHGLSVRLIVDDLTSFKVIEPLVAIGRPIQRVAGITVCSWEQADTLVPADVVIEAFACELPASYVDAMARAGHGCIWINLEYLSAESWTTSHHLLPSPHPRLPLVKYFFFPGFTAGSGGLLRERDIPRVSPGAPANDNWLRIYVFAYRNAPIAALLNAWDNDEAHITCGVAGDTFAEQVRGRGGASEPAHVHLQIEPFVPQPDFDRVLERYDVCFVRGEDSFLRAQWVAKPFVWQIYPQEGAAHWVKLDAFLALYTEGMVDEAARALRIMWHAWNGDPSASIEEAWFAYRQQLPVLRAHALEWRTKLMAMPDLATNLVTFCGKIAKI
jgi:uncharacterized repeat protein (TIGR03837 family)